MLFNQEFSFIFISCQIVSILAGLGWYTAFVLTSQVSDLVCVQLLFGGK